MSDDFKPPQRVAGAEHGVVYRNEAEYCGWPFYCGLWRTENGDIVAGFKRVRNDYAGADDVDHGQIAQKPAHLVTIRSADGGRNWSPASLQTVFDMSWKKEEDFPEGKAADWSGLPPLDFFSRDTLIMGGGVPSLFGQTAQSWMRASTDGGKSWRAPIILPRYDLPSLTNFGSSMYATREDGVHLLSCQTNSPEALSPRPLVYGCMNGADWYFLSFMVEERPPTPFYVLESPYSPLPHFYPRIVVLPNGKVLASLRYQRDARSVIWTEIYESHDGGRTWGFLSRLNDIGAPGDLVPMRDGRVVCVYGYRTMPSGVRYKVSEDDGRSWGREIILRDDGGSWDCGYPRVIEVEPGKLLTVYYINRKDDPMQMNGGVRHIAWTMFRP
ncbi:sialidase family protein [Marinicaulis aureus]|uniref:Sialidase family protein n=1 Tax=Hyphococcus aureus TaxID=2666033 RepID=A0ABW1KU75_9PROT